MWNQKLSDDDNPSAPPFSDAGGEIKQEQSHVSTRPNDMPSAAAAVATNGFERKTRTTSLQNNIRQETPKTSGRVAASAENGVPLSSFHARLPTFHARLDMLVLIWSCTQICTWGSESVYDVDQSVSQKTQVIPPLPEDRFLCGFSHIFAGMYAAGYYSYKGKVSQIIDNVSRYSKSLLEFLIDVNRC